MGKKRDVVPTCVLVVLKITQYRTIDPVQQYEKNTARNRGVKSTYTNSLPCVTVKHIIIHTAILLYFIFLPSMVAIY